MRSERHPHTALGRLGPLALALALTACVEGGVVLERGSLDGSVTDQGSMDGSTDQPVTDTNVTDMPMLDDGVDAGPTGNVTIRLTGFEDYAGMTIRARLGALSGTVVSGVIQADGTAVLILNSIFTILNSTYFESYVDEDGSGSCNPLFDHLAAANIILQRDGDNYEAELDESDTSAGITGCFVLN